MLSFESLVRPQRGAPVLELQSPQGRWRVREFYCEHADCDCRRVIVRLQNVKTGKIEATIGHGFEPSNDDDMPQTYLEPLSMQSSRAPMLLRIAEAKLFGSHERTRVFLDHYAAVKRAVRSPDARLRKLLAKHPDPLRGDSGPAFPSVRTTPKIPRNKPCPCGSGIKYKKCCLLAAASETTAPPSAVVRFPELGPITAPGHATETDVAGTTEPRAEPVEEIKLSVDSRWDRELLLRLMRQRGLEGYRRKGQRHTTVLVRARPAEIDELWDDFVALSSHLEDRLDSAVQAFVDALQWQGERPRIPADSVEGAAVPDQGQLFPQMPQRREA